MNAYQLSDLLQTTESTNNQASNMLRQQADRIAELEKCLFQMQNACVHLNNLFPQTKPLSDEEIEQTVKAWFNLHPECDLNEQFVTPLYSVKELCKRIAKIRGEG